MHYLVTGGAGFIGSHIAEALLGRGDTVRALDNFSSGQERNIPADVEVVRASITNPDAIAPAFDGIDGVFHCAALASVQLSIDKPRETQAVNITGTLNVILASRNAGVKRLVYSTSAAVYGDQDHLPFTEDMQARPKSPYALEKYVSEHYCSIASLVWGIETVSLRYFNVFGPRAATKGAYVNVIPIFLRQRAKGEPLTITGEGTNTRDYIFVDDVVHANLLAMDSKNVGKGEVINIGSGVRKSVKDVAGYFHHSTTIIAPRIEQKHAQADITRAKELLGWEPQVSFEDGLKRTMEWFENFKD